MQIVTLCSDWGLKDPYLAAVKGKILSQVPDAFIVDISHDIPPFNSIQAAFILKNCYKDFPSGTIHVVAVNTEESTKTPHTIVEVDGQYIVGSDNGVFSMILDKAPDKIIEMDIPQDSGYFTFSAYNRFVSAVTEIAKGTPLEKLGDAKNSLNQKIPFQPVTDGSVLKGMVIYVDNFENAITNISEKQFLEFGQNRKFEISLRGDRLTKIDTAYSDVSIGDIVALFGTHGFLEIAVNMGNASSLLGLYLDEIVRVEFLGN
jgi:S-adenosylmethionine hydrolase